VGHAVRARSKVDEQVVAAGLLKAEPGVFRVCGDVFESLLLAHEGLLDLFLPDRVGRVLVGRPELVAFLFQVGDASFG